MKIKHGDNGSSLYKYKTSKRDLDSDDFNPKRI